MNILKIFLSATLLMLAFTMSGCQGTNSDTPESNTTNPPDTNNTVPPIDTNASKNPVSLQFVNSGDINVSSSGEQRTVNLRAFDASGTLNTEGSITVQYPQKPDAGILSPNTATIVDGIAQFTYTAPIDLQGRVDAGDTFSDYKFFSTTNEAVKTTLHVNYTPSSSITVTDPVLKSLILSESSINVTQSNQTNTLTLFAYTDQNTTNINLGIGIQYGNSGFDVGYFTPVSPQVVDGHVTFEYVGPKNLLATSGTLASTVFTLYDKANPGITVPLTVNFVPSIPVLRVETPTVALTQNLQTKTVTVLAFDSATNQAFNSGTVVLEYPADIINGTVSGGTFIQNEANLVNGKATFEFTGPDTLTTIANQTFTFKYKENQSVSTSLLMKYTPDLPQIAHLGINEVNTTIAQDQQLHTVVINALDVNGNFVTSGDINVKFPSVISNGTDVGSFSSLSIPLINGQATFSYTGPQNIQSTSTAISSPVAFEFSDAAAVSSNPVQWNVSFLSSTPTLRVESPIVTLKQNSQIETVSVLAFDSVTNQALNAGTVVVEYPTDIINGTVSGGTFTQNEASIVNGKATFEFTGPDTLKGISDQTFTFKYKENTNANPVTLTVKYTPDAVKIVFDDGNITTVTKNGEIKTINLTVYAVKDDKENNKKYYSLYPDGNIKINYPSEVTDGKNVGSFNSTIVPVVNGKVSFTYTAPNPLDGNDSMVFTFYHDAYPSLSAEDLNISIVPEAGQIVLTNYVLDALYETSMNLETTKGMTFYVEDDKGVRIDDSNVTSINVTVLNPELATLEDTAGNSGSSLSITGKNSVQMNLRTKTISGIVPVKVYSEFKDANNADQNLTRVFNVVVLSGPPTAMSLSYAGTEQNTTSAKFIENWVLTVTDKYNNLVNTKPSVSMGALIGYANDSSNSALNAASYLYFDSSTNDGNLTDANPDTFTSVHNAFDDVDLVNDKLVLFGGTGYKFNAYGKWDIKSFTANQLALVDDFNGSAVTGLSYAVGHNFRNEVCNGSPAVANVYAKDGNNTIGSTGSMIVQVEYDYYLVGKSVMLWTNLVGEDNNTTVKVGLGKKVTLRGQGLESPEYDLSSNYNGVISLPVKISNTVESYKNARFVYGIKTSSSVTVNNVITTSQSDIYSCALTTTEATGQNIDHSGIAYVDVNVTADSTGGTIQLVNILPAKEF